MLGNADTRQCVFVRTDGAFRAHMIYFGYVFNGPHWDFPDHDLYGLYPRSFVYETLSSPAVLEPWLSRIENTPLSIYTYAVETVPSEWLAPEDRASLQHLIHSAHDRRRTFRPLLTQLFTRPCETHFCAWRARRLRYLHILVTKPTSETPATKIW